MTPTVSIDTTEFQAAMRQYLARTKSTLEEATNRRMFFVLARAFVLLKPHNAGAERARIRAYLDEVKVRYSTHHERDGKIRVRKNVGRDRLFRRVHKIAVYREIMEGRESPWKGKDRYNGAEAMKAAAAKVRRQSIGSVGYLKSVVAKAIKLLRGSFTQFGRQSKKSNGRTIKGNAALIGFAAEYGTSTANVGMHKGGRAYVKKAEPGISTSAIADMAVAIKNGQEARVSSSYAEAFQRAFNDERVEMSKYLAEVMQSDANEHMEKPL